MSTCFLLLFKDIQSLPYDYYYYSDKPDIKTKEIEVIENRTQTITCEAEGNPDPEVHVTRIEGVAEA